MSSSTTPQKNQQQSSSTGLILFIVLVVLILLLIIVYWIARFAGFFGRVDHIARVIDRPSYVYGNNYGPYGPRY